MDLKKQHQKWLQSVPQCLIFDSEDQEVENVRLKVHILAKYKFDKKIKVKVKQLLENDTRGKKTFR